jgi:hypothetical protein
MPIRRNRPELPPDAPARLHRRLPAVEPDDGQDPYQDPNQDPDEAEVTARPDGIASSAGDNGKAAAITPVASSTRGNRVRLTNASPVSGQPRVVAGRGALAITASTAPASRSASSRTASMFWEGATDEAGRALPPANMVTILKDAKNGADEGRAMAEIAH